MSEAARSIFQAIHEGKWLSVEYLNKQGQTTSFWIGVKDLDATRGRVIADGLRLKEADGYPVTQLALRLAGILSARVIDGSYSEVNQSLIDDIDLNPHKYKRFFDNPANLDVLSYLEACNRLDCTPYRVAGWELVSQLDRESFLGESLALSSEQFAQIVKAFQLEVKNANKHKIRRLAMNALSVTTSRGLYLLAYKKLFLDVAHHTLRQDDKTTICTEFSIDSTNGEKKESVRRFLDAQDYDLLFDFEANQELIKDKIAEWARRTGQRIVVDDRPYMIAVGSDVLLDLHSEYQAIVDCYAKGGGGATFPIRAFFGEVLSRPRRRKAYPITLLGKSANLDQLLAINNAMKYPLTYVQGPPGTGKTHTIVNTILTAFFNGKTVLFCSHNNHPIDEVYHKLQHIISGLQKIPFPVLRLGNREKQREALAYMRRLYREHKGDVLSDQKLDKNKDRCIEQTRKLSELLKNYERVLDLQERREALERVLDSQKDRADSLDWVSFSEDLRQRQLRQIEREIAKIGSISDDQAASLLGGDEEALKEYFSLASKHYLRGLFASENEDLANIIVGGNGENEESEEVRLEQFTRYLSLSENIKRLQKIFPVIITTCISAHKIGAPEPLFDITIIDEASQCNNAVSLVPIIRGESLLLVGDPQQLKPVILLDESTNQRLRQKYNITDEYDYRQNSIYKTYLACDAVSREILLSHHYRCNKKIIAFNNKKYYNSKLVIDSESHEQQPLVFKDVRGSASGEKNTSLAEVHEAVRYASLHKNQKIAIITPFVNQRRLIEQELREARVENATCGTIHAFQGDEKDVVLFSPAVTEDTSRGTYEWLKNNKELINVATSRAKDRLVVLADGRSIKYLSAQTGGGDDLAELVGYVRQNGSSVITPKTPASRALGIKPYSTQTEEAFLTTLNHALGNIWRTQSHYSVEREVAIAQVFNENISLSGLFYTGRFDFVIYQRQGSQKCPVLAIELNGREHYEREAVRVRDEQKKRICREHHFELVCVENSYARRYNYIKGILLEYFKRHRG